MATSIKKTKECFEILSNYKGKNPYINMIVMDVITKQNRTVTDFEIDYVVKNHTFTPQKIGKIVRISEWFADKKQEQWEYKHKISKLQVTYLLGETDGTYHCYVNYKQNQDKPVMCFIPKTALMDELFDFEEEYNDTNVDFDFYDEKLKKYEISLLNIQKETCLFMLNRKKCIIANEPGTGKTLAAIVASMVGGFKKILVVCPATLKTNWYNELIRLEDSDNIGIINSDRWIDNKKYTIVNYDILENFHKIPKVKNKFGKIVKSRKNEDIEKCLKESKLLNGKFDYIILDEGHLLSNYKTTRTEIIDDFIKKSQIEQVSILTGTPVNNNIDGYYQILKLINHRVTNNQEYFFNYFCDQKKIPKKGEKERITNIYLELKKKNTWFDLNSQEKDELKEKINREAIKIPIIGDLDPKKLEELQYITKDYYLLKRKSDLDSIAEKEIIENVYDLTDEERITYNNLWSEYVKEQVNNGKLEEDLNEDLTSLIILRAFVAEKMVSRTIELANSFLEKGLKVFIFTTYTKELEELNNYYGDRSVIFKGGMTSKKRDLAVSKFNDANSGVDVFIGNVIASNVGISLHKNCYTAIGNSYPYSYSSVDQVLNRIHRVGSKEKVTIYFQMFKDTISEDVWNKVIKKEILTKSLIKK